MALQRGPFKNYWISQLISLAGSWMQNTAASLVVLSITTSALAVGALNVVSALPLLLFSLYGGVIADRHDRRQIIIFTQTSIGIVTLIYAWLIWSGWLEYWHMLVLSALAGTIMAFELPASQSFVSEMVEREDLPEALALNSASFNATRTIGPAMAGLVIGLVGTAGTFLINAATLLAPISVLFWIKGKTKPQPKMTTKAGTSSLREGMQHIRTHDDLLGLVLLSAAFSFLVFPNLLVLMPLYVKDHLGGGDGWVAMMISVLGLGSLAGSIGMLRGSRLELAAGGRMRRAMAGLAIGLAWLSISQAPWMAVPGVMVAGYSFTTGNTQISTRLQQLAPDAMRGRVLSVNSLAFNGVMPFATIIISLFSQLIGQPIVMMTCALLTVAASAWLWKRYVWRAFVPATTAALPASAAA